MVTVPHKAHRFQGAGLSILTQTVQGKQASGYPPAHLPNSWEKASKGPAMQEAGVGESRSWGASWRFVSIVDPKARGNKKEPSCFRGRQVWKGTQFIATAKHCRPDGHC